MKEQTFLFADLAGFSALTEAHGDEDAADLVGDFCNCVRELLGGYDAEEVKTIGDAIMLRCSDQAQAVELGVRIVEEVGGRPGFPVVRVGMHSGAATERRGDWFGSAVNLAARVSAAAGGDEVLLSEATYKGTRNVPGVELSRHGEHRFKNLRGPVRLYRAARRGRGDHQRLIDPVCRMAVDPERAAGTLDYDGRTYLFCSLECVRVFSEAPESYVA